MFGKFRGIALSGGVGFKMEMMNEDRKDKFISNVYKAKIDSEILSKDPPKPNQGYNTNTYINI